MCLYIPRAKHFFAGQLEVIIVTYITSAGISLDLEIVQK
jgi:hypothetical protein